MERRTRLNVILILCAAVLGTLLWATRPTPPAPPRPLLDIAPDEVERIEIRYPGHGPTMVLERGGGRWRLAAPVSARADAARVNELLDLARVVPERRYPTAEIDAAQAGLESPLARVTFNDKAAIVIGGRGPLESSGRYLRIGDTVALAEIPNPRAIGQSWTQWIDPRLLAPEAELEQLRLPELTLSRTETGGWRVTPPRRDRGADVAQATVDTWRRARALAIEPADERAPVATVELVFADGRVRELGVIAREPELVLRDKRIGVDYHLAANKGPPLLDMRHPVDAQQLGPTTPRQSSIPLTPPADASD